MTIEVRLSGQQRRSFKVDDTSKSVKKKNKCCRRTCYTRKRATSGPAVCFPLQRLYLTCREVFKTVGTVPSPDDVERICRILDGMMPGDVGLSRNLQNYKPKTNVEGPPKVSCATIYQCENFSLCLFFLPPTAVIPLHNHPGMTVFGKILLGEVHVKAYDLVNPETPSDSSFPSQKKLAILKANGVFTAPCDASVLYPTSGGNIHAFTAITPCVILDVIGPPYSKKDGRDCSYYREIPYSALPCEGMVKPAEEGESYWWLEEIEMPENSAMIGIEYRGPQIVEITA